MAIIDDAGNKLLLHSLSTYSLAHSTGVEQQIIVVTCWESCVCVMNDLDFAGIELLLLRVKVRHKHVLSIAALISSAHGYAAIHIVVVLDRG